MRGKTELRRNISGIQEAFISNEFKQEQEQKTKDQFDEVVDHMRIAMPPHLKVSAAHRMVGQSAKLVDKALEVHGPRTPPETSAMERLR